MRLCFQEKEIISWIRRFVDREHYEAYTTYRKELLLSPLKSTATLRSAWTTFETRPVESEIRKVLSEKGIKPYLCTVNWELGLFVFDDMEEFLRWAEDHTSPKELDQITRFNPRKYAIFVTAAQDVYLLPGVSTKPMKKACILHLSDDALTKVLTELEKPDPENPDKEPDIPLVRVQRIDLREDRLPRPTVAKATG